MTVEELIRRLQQYPKNMEVYAYNHDNCLDYKIQDACIQFMKVYDHEEERIVIKKGIGFYY